MKQFLVFVSLLFTFSCFFQVLKVCGQQNQTVEKEEISGKVISIVDGDRFDVLVKGNKTIRIRILLLCLNENWIRLKNNKHNEIIRFIRI